MKRESEYATPPAECLEFPFVLFFIIIIIIISLQIPQCIDVLANKKDCNQHALILI